MIEIKSLAFKNFEPLSVSVGRNQVVRIIADDYGDSMTFLKILSGIMVVYEGYVMINGYDMRLNYDMFQHHVQSILAHHSFYRSIGVGLQLSAKSKRWSGVDVSFAAMKMLGIGNYYKKCITDMNNADQRMAEICRLISCPAQIWVLHNIDAFFSEDQKCLIFELIKQRVVTGGTVFFSSDSNFCNELISKEIVLMPA